MASSGSDQLHGTEFQKAQCCLYGCNTFNGIGRKKSDKNSNKVRLQPTKTHLILVTEPEGSTLLTLKYISRCDPEPVTSTSFP
jgi:hypothetical protein